MKTLVIITILAALATGVVKQNLIEFHPSAALNIPNKIKDKAEYLSCYENEFENRGTTGLLPADAVRKCKLESQLKRMSEALAAHRYEDLDALK